MTRHWPNLAIGLVLMLGLVIVHHGFRPDRHRVGVRMEIGQRFFTANDFDRAIEVMDSVIADYPRHAVALHVRGLAHDRLGEAEMAIGDYDRAIELDPAFFDAINDRGILLTKIGRWEDGLADFRRLVALDPNSLSARVNYAFALQKAGRSEEAAAGLEIIPASQRDDTVYYLIACLAISREDWMLADEALSAALALNPQDLKLWLNRGIARWRLGQADGAIADWDQVEALDEDWMLRATIAQWRERIRE